MQKRRRFKQTKSLKDRLLEKAQNLREQAKLLPYGSVRDATLKKARQAEAAAHMDEWLNSPGLQPPKKDDTGPQLAVSHARLSRDCPVPRGRPAPLVIG